MKLELDAVAARDNLDVSRIVEDVLSPWLKRQGAAALVEAKSAKRK
jgi:hypothetical protein